MKHSKWISSRIRNGLWAAALAVAAFAPPAQAIRPESSPAPELQGNTGPYRSGLKHLRPMQTRDLLDPGERLQARKLALPGEATNQIVRRLNARLRAWGGEFRVRNISRDSKGNQHIRLDQYHRGYPVIGGDAVIHVNANREIYAVGGSLAEGIVAANAPLFSEDQARLRSRANLNPALQHTDKQAPRLVIFDGRLAYETLIQEPGATPGAIPRLWKSFIDATSGELLFRENRILHGAPVGGAPHAVTGSRLTGEGGQNITIQGWRDNQNIYFLRNNLALWGVYNQDTFDWSQNLTGDWGITDRAAISLARNMELTQTYSSQILGRNSFDNAGAFAAAYVHEGTNYVNAYWDGSALYFGDGDGIISAPLTVLDVAAHEFGHAVTQYTSDLNYSYESGALNESYSDILGALVEFWAQPDGRTAYPVGQDGLSDYLMGEDCWLDGEALRDLRNPGRFGQPSYYLGTNWYTGSGDNGGVHYNSGVQNFAFYLLAEGGTGNNDGHPYAITGLGIEAAGEIAMYANQYLLTSTSQYRDAREAWIQAAVTLGHDSQTVADVWTACGVLELVNNLAITPANLDFGNVGLGTTASLNLSFSNNGANPTTITGLAFNNPLFTSPTTTPLTLPGGSSVNIPVRFTPTALGPIAAQLVVTSNADDNPSITVALSAIGAPPASMSVNPASFTVGLNTGETTTRTLTISNNGSGDSLDWNLQGIGLTQPLQGPQNAASIDILAWVPYTDMTGEYVNVVAAINAYSKPHTLTNSTTLSAATLETQLADKDVFLMPEREIGSIPTGTGTAFRPVLQAFLQRGGVIILHFPYMPEATQFLSEAGLMQLAPVSVTWSTLPCTITLPNHPLMDSVTAPLNMENATAYTTVLDSTTVIASYNGYMVVGEKRIATGRVIVMGPDFYAYNSNWARILSNAINLAPTSTAPWVTSSALSGQVAAGQSQTLTLTFNAGQLMGGSYNTDLMLGHDDPTVTNPMPIPLTLNVDGFRRLSVNPTAHHFGNLWVGAQATRTFTFTNSGSEATTITSIQSGNPEFTHNATLPMVLQPFQSAAVNVTYAPTALGADTTLLSITSNAEDFPNLAISLSGQGTSPPTLSITPSSVNETVGSGDSVITTLSVANTGGANLTFQFEGGDGKVLINEFSNDPDFIELWNRGSDRNLGGWILSWVDDAGSAVLSFTFPPSFVLRAGRRVVVREFTGTPNDSTFYAGANIGWVTSSTVAISLKDASGLGVDFVRTTSSTTLPPSGTTWTGTGVNFSGYTAYRNVNTDSDSPVGWAYSNSPSEFALNPGQSLVGSFPSWITLSPTSGTVLPGSATNLNLTLKSAGLFGGTHASTLYVKSNDPLMPATGMPFPVQLIVDGQRRISVSPDSLHFGGVWSGDTSTLSFTLNNPGNEATTITSILSDRPVFSVVAPMPLTLPPFGSVQLQVVFAPTALGMENGTLTITSNAEDFPSLPIILTGEGTAPPSAVLSPSSFTVNLAHDQAPADRTATLANVGGASMQWRIESVTQTGSPLGIAPSAVAASLPPIRTDRIYAATNYNHAYAPGKVIVAFKPGLTHFANSPALANLGIAEIRELAKAINPKTRVQAHTGRKLLLLQLTQGGDVLRAIDILRQDPNVAYAEPDYIQKIVGLPNDAAFSSLYGMHNTGQTGGITDADIDAPEAWDRHTGNRSLLIGVIDTGIDYLHPDLAANIWTNPGEIAGNGLDDDGNGFIDDIHGWDFANDDSNPTDGNAHGTHCAGTIGGVGNNGIGVAGVMWTANLVALKFLSDGGSGTTSDAIDAVNYATAMEIPITSNSWGGGGFSQALMDAIATGGLFIAAAGNSGTNNDLSPHYPSSYELDNILAVAATDHADALASFSCFGATSVDLGAPGVNTYSTTPGNTYQSMSGTSMATPHVSGAAGLIWTFNPTLTAAQVKAALMASVDPIASLSGITVTGGRLNVHKALDEAGPSWLSATPLTPGTLAPGDSTPLTLTIDPTGLVAGTWTGVVTVATDDPANPVLPINVTANISGCRSLAITPSTHDFGARFVGTSVNRDFTLQNTCNDSVTLSSAAFSGTGFQLLDSLPLAIPAFGTFDMTVRFQPLSAGAFSATLSLTTNADSDPVKTIALTGQGILPPVPSVTPASVNQVLASGQSTQVELTVSNSGGSDLLWSLGNVGQGFAVAAPSVATRYDSSHFLPQIRGAVDTRRGVPITQAAGGPDAFGYRWSDSDEPGGPAYQWQDISTTGTPVLSGCLDCYTTRTLSFAFPFYGNSFNAVNITSKGWVNFGTPSYQWTNYPLPSISMPQNLIAAFFDDLTTGNAGAAVYFQDFGNRAIIQFHNMGFYSGSGTLTFQIVLQANGTMLFYYNNMAGSVLSGTTGIQNATQNTGLQVQYNTSYVRNQLAVRIQSLPDWLKADNLAGIVAPGTNHIVNLTLDASTLASGTYNQTITLNHNHPTLPALQIPVTLTVQGMGLTRVIRVGTSAQAMATGTRFRLRRITVGAETTGLLQGSRYSLFLQ